MSEEMPENWAALTDEDSEYFSKEFYREADKSHALFDERMWAVARCKASDDILYKVHDGRYAQIHLTWAVETTPNFPDFDVFDTFNEWRESVDADSASVEH